MARMGSTTELLFGQLNSGMNQFIQNRIVDLGHNGDLNSAETNRIIQHKFRSYSQG